MLLQELLRKCRRSALQTSGPPDWPTLLLSTTHACKGACPLHQRSHKHGPSEASHARHHRMVQSQAYACMFGVQTACAGQKKGTHKTTQPRGSARSLSSCSPAVLVLSRHGF